MPPSTRLALNLPTDAARVAPADAPRLLVLDTASETVHLGATDGGRAWTRALPGGAQASAHLLPALTELLKEAGLALGDLDAIGFGQGPGAFTGVRAACAVAQGLAFGAGRPVLALDTLLAVAEDARGQGARGTVWAVVDARMGEAYAACYETDDDDRRADAADAATAATAPARWRTVEAPALHDPAALAARLDADGAAVHLAGNSLVAHAAAWAVVGSATRWPQAQPRAQALLALARAAWEDGQGRDAAEALPVYVRDKVADTTAERAERAKRAPWTERDDRAGRVAAGRPEPAP